MKGALAFGVAAVLAAQLVRGPANELAPSSTLADPYIPSPRAARLQSLGYHEVAADLLFFRLVGYFGTQGRTADAMAALVEAIVTVDPRFSQAYGFGVQAMIHGINEGIGREHYLRAIKILERGAVEFSGDYKIPKLAGEIYLLDLKTQDPAERRAWDEAGTALLERAVRKPNAPASLGTWIAHLRTKLGQQERARAELRELLLISNDKAAREALLAKLAELENADAQAIELEIVETRRRFEQAWRRDRPYVPASLYVIIGAPIEPGFDLGDLATGGRNVVQLPDEPLEPL
jgi:tetratricopeptide (TPR) repeat protein